MQPQRSMQPMPRAAAPLATASGFDGRWAADTSGASGWSASGGAVCHRAPEGLALAFDGELYNCPALCRALALNEATPLPQLLAALWRQHGVDGLQRLDGVFVLAVADRDGLHLVRDASGMRNLYCHVADGPRPVVSFSTGLDRLVALPGVPRRLARRSLHEYLRFLDIAAPHTIYDGVQALEAGECRQWTARGDARRWLPLREPPAPAAVGFDEAVDRLDACLHASIRARLAGAARPAAFLSGGIDSALLCAIGAAQRRDLDTLTVGFDGEAFDESPVARRLAERLGLPHRVLRFDRAQYLAAFERLAGGLEQPMADPATPATLLACEQAQPSHDVILDGSGADEALGQLPPRHVRVAVGQASRLPAPLRRGLLALLRQVPGGAGYAPILDFEHPAELLIRWRGFSRRDIEALCGEPVSLAHTTFYRTFERFAPGAHFERASALLDTMPADRLRQSARLSAAVLRFPFLDRDSDRWLRSLPDDYRQRPGEPKRVLRALLARYLPPALWDLPKHGFDFPLQAFLAGDGHALVRRHLDAGRWQATGLLDPAAVRRLGDAFIAGDGAHVFRVWALVLLSAWLEAREPLT